METSAPTCLDDNAAASFVGGLMTSLELARVEEHLDGCTTCRQHLAAMVRGRTISSLPPHASPAPEEARLLPPGAVLGRYHLRGVLGVGAMGVVYAAWDTELAREVALKTVRAHGGGERLVAEAQALARLKHPNVVTVHDVGREGERVFIAMELISGGTLRAWLAKHPRATVKEIVALFAQAGRGLAAAHAAGLVHRDFKPENVLVGDDGRVRVTDFGLARATDENRDAREVVGTPAYMAPEQLTGGVADARSDEFALCVALWEALSGERPYGGDGIDSIAREIARGRLRPMSRGRRVPGALVRVLSRGLAASPAQRFPSLEALLAALDRATRSPRRGRVLLAVAPVALLAVVAALAWPRLRAPTVAACDGGRQLAGVWDPARREAVRAAFARSGAAGATEAMSIAGAEIDRYAARWSAIDTESCEAARAGGQAATARPLQARCLARRLRELDTLARVLTQADAATVRRAAEAAYALSSVEDCADLALLRAQAPARDDAATRGRRESIEDRLAEARAYENVGDYTPGVTRAKAALDDALTLGDQALAADAELTLGRLEIRTAEFVAAEKHLSEAVLAAEAGQRDELRAAALAKLVLLVGVRLRRIPDAVELARRADAVVERLAGEPRLKVELLYAEAMLAGSQGDFTTAAAPDRQALALAKRSDDAGIAANLADGLGMALFNMGKFDEALVELRAGLEARERLYGPHHLSVSFSLNNVAMTLASLNRAREALPLVKRALAIAEAAVGADHPDVAASLQILADTEAAVGDRAAAEPHYRRALVLMEKKFGAQSPNLTNSLLGLAALELAAKRWDDAERTLKKVLDIKERALGPTHPDVSIGLNALATLYNQKGDYRAGLRHGERALALVKAEEDPDGTATSLVNVGYAAGKLGQSARAASLLERATALLARRGDASADLAEARFDLAEVLWARGDKARARTLAQLAQKGWADDAHGDERARLTRWLATH